MSEFEYPDEEERDLIAEALEAIESAEGAMTYEEFEEFARTPEGIAFVDQILADPEEREHLFTDAKAAQKEDENARRAKQLRENDRN